MLYIMVNKDTYVRMHELFGRDIRFRQLFICATLYNHLFSNVI